MKRLAFTALSAAIASATPAVAQAELQIVTTLPDLAAIASAVAGDHATVTALVTSDQDPHYVDGRPSMILPLNRADLLITNGMELEVGWLPPLVTSARNAKIQPGSPGFLDTSFVIDRIQFNPGPVDRAGGDIHPGGNPHFTFDPRQAKHIAKAILQRIIQLDATHAAEITVNHTRFAKQLDALIKGQRARFAKLPAPKRRAVAYHMSLPYLWQWLNIEQIATIEPKPGIPPNPGHVARVLKTMRATGSRVIIQESYYPSRASKTLAKLARGELVIIPAGTRFAKGETYVQHITEVTDALHAALTGK